MAFVFGEAFDKDFVAGDPPSLTYTVERCAEFIEYYPEASSCAAAATAHHFEEVVAYRVEAGVLGLPALGALIFLRRRWPEPETRLIPDLPLPSIATALFGLSTFVLLGLGLGAIAFLGGSGAGSYLSAGLVAAAAFALYARRAGYALLRTIRTGLTEGPS